jgi:hypothetical protein
MNSIIKTAAKITEEQVNQMRRVTQSRTKATHKGKTGRVLKKKMGKQ